jgi:hypothetical protein
MKSVGKLTKKLGPAGKGSAGGGFRLCYILVGAFVTVIGLSLLYTSVFRRGKRGGASSATASSEDSIAIAVGGNRALVDVGLEPAPVTTQRDECGRGDPNDPDAWLDFVAERGCYPKITPSWYAQVHGIEPFERPDLKPFDLHTYPTDDWYDLAKKATDRCDLEVHQQIVGGDKGMADDVVWVSGLFDLKRGEGANKDFQRPMEEYYRRFQIVLDRGALPALGQGRGCSRRAGGLVRVAACAPSLLRLQRIFSGPARWSYELTPRWTNSISDLFETDSCSSRTMGDVWHTGFLALSRVMLVLAHAWRCRAHVSAALARRYCAEPSPLRPH